MEDIDLSSLKVQKLPDEKTTDQNEPKKKSSNGVGKEKNADKNDAKKTQLCIVCSCKCSIFLDFKVNYRVYII